MIVFDLACAGAGHVFEAWFGSTGDYEAQRERGLVECPVCGDSDVDKAVMAPRVSPKGNRGNAVPAVARDDAAAMPAPQAMKALLGKMAAAQRQALEKSDYVGDRFADEARAIHDGESDQRSIHGVATPVQARGLIEDGIGVMPLPFPVRPPRTDN